MTRTITALFDSNSEAQRAEERLVNAGVSRGSINIIAQGTTGTSAGTSGTSASGMSTSQSGHTSSDDGGFFGALRDLFLPDEDRYSYEEGIRRGGFLLTARVDEQLVDRAIDILDDEGSVDLDSRESEWRSSGWSGYQGGTGSGLGAGGAASGLGAGSQGSSFGSTGSGLGTGSQGSGYGGTTGQTTGFGATGASGTSGIPSTTGRSTAGTQTGLTGNQDETIQVVEERLQVGKREVERGRTRVRSYVVEQPIQEQVTLREEHVSVERRPVERTLTGTEASNLFQERTINLTETAEEAVVAKQAVVKEELHIHKDATQRTETVHDTVRRTEVEVDDDVSAGTTADPTRRSGSGI